MGMCLTVASGSTSRVTVNSCNSNSERQLWITDDKGYLYNKIVPGKCLKIKGSDKSLRMMNCAINGYHKMQSFIFSFFHQTIVSAGYKHFAITVDENGVLSLEKYLNTNALNRAKNWEVLEL